MLTDISHFKATETMPCSVTTRVAGFTLVELLIALLLGTIVIGAVGTVFISSQQTYLRLTAYNNAQEAFRYASHAITRTTRGAEAIVAPPNDNTLVIQLGPETGGINQNCLGATVTGREFNRFTISANALTCEVSSDASTWTGPQEILVRGIDSLNIGYASGDFTKYWEKIYRGRSQVTDWGSVSGIRVTVAMTEGYQVNFTSSVRARLTPEVIIIRP
jgi:type II secretory pathway pseudopilin PulG